MKNLLAAMTLLIGLSLPTHSLSQQLPLGPQCGPMEKYYELLENKWKEDRLAIGINPNNTITEIFYNSETGTFTVLVTMPSGLSCQMMSGQNFQIMNEVKKKDTY